MTTEESLTRFWNVTVRRCNKCYQQLCEDHEKEWHRLIKAYVTETDIADSPAFSDEWSEHK